MDQCNVKLGKEQSKFRPSTAVNIKRLDSTKNNVKKVRPMTSKKYKQVYATLLAKTKSSTDELKIINIESELGGVTNFSDKFNVPFLGHK